MTTDASKRNAEAARGEPAALRRNETATSKEDENPDGTDGKRRRRWRLAGWTWRELERIGALVAIVATILGCSYIGYQWFHAQLTSYIDDKIEPYDNLLTGIVLVHDRDFDGAVPYFRKALDAFDRKGVPEGRLKAAVNHYTLAVVTSRNPSEYRHDMERLKRYIGQRVPMYGWHQEQLGWFALFTSDLAEADVRFKLAVREYRKERSIKLMGTAEWALALLRLCEGKPSEAFNHGKEAVRSNYNDFNILKLHFEADYYLQEYSIDQLGNICGKTFSDAYPVFIKQMIEFGRAELAGVLKPDR